MGLLKILGVGKEVSEVVGATAKPVEAIGNVLDALFTSKEEVLTLDQARERLKQKPMLAQVELNKVEAAHPSVFVAGWRPFVGWVAGSALAYHFILHPLLTWGVAVWAPEVLAPPALAIGDLLTLLTLMLGVQGIRSYEKTKGTARNKL